ncbi:MAG: GWxTD domain-containing protein [candidate division KSB1 bacterium]|nr:GWxTD domain-containing protein [candidate division KSB1 bacterium]
MEDLDIQIRIDRPELAEPTCFRERKRLEIPAFSSESGEYYYLDMKGFVVDSGEVALYMSMSDSARGRSGVVNQEFKVRYFGEELTLSDVLFVSQIRRAGEPSNLMRHGYLMIPAVARSFEVTGDSTWAWIYFEVNNLGKPSDRSTAYDVRLWVTDLTGRKSFEKTERGNNAKSRDIARVEKIPLHGMPSGVYRLDLEIEEAATHRTVRTGAYFSVWNPRLGESDLLPMEAGDEREYYDQIKYIATEDELRLFESLDRQAKQKFILWFFEVRDPDPRTPENEFLIEHLRRIAYCKAHFAGGVNSDMGRIYIKYGPPLEIQRWFSSTEYSKPVEIWTYAIRGRTEFVFVDRNGDGRYVLVHSSHPDEFANPEWEAELRR